MEPNESQHEAQAAKQSVFSVMNNIVDMCEQPDNFWRLMTTLARYSDRNGICWPTNKTLAEKTRRSRSTVKRMLKQLVADGELEILETGGGDQKRVISLKRYTGVGSPMHEPGVGSPMHEPGVGSHSPGNVSPEQPYNSQYNNSSAHAEFVRLWCERYKSVLKERYVFQGGKDGRHVKKLLASSGKTPAQLIEVAEAAWKRPSGFWCKQAVSISGFNSRFNEIRQEIKNGTGKRKTTASDRNIGTANEGRASQYAGVGKIK